MVPMASIDSEHHDIERAESVPQQVRAERELSLEKLLQDIKSLEALALEWPKEIANGAKARADAIDELNAEAFRRLLRCLKEVPALGAVLREAAGDEVVYAVLRRHGILKPSLHERVEDALDSIRPMLASHGGDVELVGVEPPRVEVRFLGACDGCPASALTFYSGVKKAIQDAIPEITEIKQVKGLGSGPGNEVHFASPFADYDSQGWMFALKLGELSEGASISKDFGSQSVLLSRFGDRITCFANACAHMGLPLDGGEFSDGFITCPHHGFKYSLESGECLTAPEVQLRPHSVRVVGDRVEIMLAG